MEYALLFLLFFVWLALPRDQCDDVAIDRRQLRVDMAGARKDINDVIEAAHSLMTTYSRTERET